VFDSVLAQGSHYDNKLVLTDKDLERSAIVSPMLDLLRGKTISMKSSGPSGYRLYRVVKLLQKYKCHAALTLVGVLIRNEAISGNSSALHLFEAAALLHDVTSCHALIRRAQSWYNLSDRTAGLGRADNVLALKSQMDPTSWNITTFESVPPRELRALLRAIARGRSAGPIDWKVIADEYRRILTVSRSRR